MQLPKFEDFDFYVNFVENNMKYLSKSTVDDFLGFLQDQIAIVSQEKLSDGYQVQNRNDQWNLLKKRITLEVKSNTRKLTMLKNKVIIGTSYLFKEGLTQKIGRYKAIKGMADKNAVDAPLIAQQVAAQSTTLSDQRVDSLPNLGAKPINIPGKGGLKKQDLLPRDKKNVKFSGVYVEEFEKDYHLMPNLVKIVGDENDPAQVSDFCRELRRRLIITDFDHTLKFFENQTMLDFVNELDKCYNSALAEVTLKDEDLQSLISKFKKIANDYIQKVIDDVKNKNVTQINGSNIDIFNRKMLTFGANLEMVVELATEVIKDSFRID